LAHQLLADLEPLPGQRRNDVPLASAGDQWFIATSPMPQGDVNRTSDIRSGAYFSAYVADPGLITPIDKGLLPLRAPHVLRISRSSQRWMAASERWVARDSGFRGVNPHLSR
jgi:hypothetical protein